MSITLVKLNHLSLHVSEELSSQLSSEPPAPAVDLHPPPLSNSYHHTPTVPSYRLLEATVRQTPPQSLEDLHTCQSPILEHDPAPIQNSPWTESSLDQPYQKKKSHSSSIKSRYIYLFYSLHFLQCKGSIKCQTHVIYDLCKAVLTHLVIKTSHSNFLGGYNHTSFSVMAIKPNMSTLIYVLLSVEHVIAKLQLYCFGFVFISGKKSVFVFQCIVVLLLPPRCLVWRSVLRRPGYHCRHPPMLPWNTHSPVAHPPLQRCTCAGYSPLGLISLYSQTLPFESLLLAKTLFKYIWIYFR